MKIVIDTNVFISGIFWKGPPNKILSLWAQNQIRIFITGKILNEYLRILHKIDTKGNISKKWGNFILENSTILKDKDLITICRDKEDNKFLNCSILAKAKYLISGDNDLLCLDHIKNTKIITPIQFLKIYKK